MYRLPRRMLDETFATFRSCGAGKRECQLYWVSPWNDPLKLVEVVHPEHLSSRYALSIDSSWINAFWNNLADRGLGVRVQVHTHPGEAFHSTTDDAYPLIHQAGFLSLVIPDFAMGSTGFDSAYLAEIQADGTWREIALNSRIAVDE